MSTLLRIEGLEAGYGDVTAVSAVSLEVRRGEAVALVGSNGAGKTTTLRAISGLLPVRSGTIELEGRRLGGLSPAEIVALGIAHVPEGRQLFPSMTVRENLDLGARSAEARARKTETLEWVFGLFPRLADRQRLEAGYGDVTAVSAVSLEVRRGEAVALVGSNGAGKTTTLRAISGLLPVRSGTIELEGRRLGGLSPAEIVALGIAHVPEGRQLFPSMTVRENLDLGARSAEARARKTETLEWVFGLFPRLADRQRQVAGTLSGGEQQMCAIGRGLMARPKLLMLDEPSLGLAPVMVKAIFENLERINREGTTILVVEQNVLRSLQLSHRGYVLENGRIVLDGARDYLLASPHIKQAYLGL